MTSESAAAYKSNSQRARVVTEAWGADNLYCPNCSSPKLDRLSHNTRASDFCCPKCQFRFQLKGQQSRIGNSVADGAYSAMMDAIRMDETPNFYFMHYQIVRSPSPLRSGGEGRGEEAHFKTPLPVPLPAQSRGEGNVWFVRNLLLIPHFAFPPSAIIKRNPTTPKGRSSPWIGCNIALHRIPADARIYLVRTISSPSLPGEAGGEEARIKSPLSVSLPVSRGESVRIATPEEVREQFRRVKPLKEIPLNKRGWMLDVLNIVHRLGKLEFTNQDVYAFERELEQLHPGNRHIRDKIRQQLQNLARAGLLIHAGRNDYQLMK